MSHKNICLVLISVILLVHKTKHSETSQTKIVPNAINSTLENVNNKMKEIMLADIESAFKSITNLTENMLHNKIIPEMYNLTRSNKFVFKIPNTKSTFGFTMISTERSELMQPIFPNLTMNPEQILLRQRRIQSRLRNSDGSQNKKPAISNANVWSSLGLDGWSGELTTATDMLEIAHKDFNTEDWSGNITDFSEDLNEKRTTSKPEIVSLTLNKTLMDLSDNIYIARVNDPFGLSTKWSHRNETANNTIRDLVVDKRQKRDIIELYSMLKCATGCEPLLYQSYGCFCGFLGNGIAVDGIDSCCRMHDKCYEQSNCFSYLQYFVPYVWKCYRGKPICALDHGEYGGPTSCAALLCYCDMRLSICLRKYQCPLRKAVCNTSIARKLQNLFF